MEEKISTKIQKYGIQSSILTMLGMTRQNLITKEKSKKAYEGKLKKEPDWRFYEGSIYDDVEAFLNTSIFLDDLFVQSFFLPKLTEEEKHLVEEKDKAHLTVIDDILMTYGLRYPDVDVEEMKKSDSRDKYLHCRCIRKTIHLTFRYTM